MLISRCLVWSLITHTHTSSDMKHADWRWQVQSCSCNTDCNDGITKEIVREIRMKRCVCVVERYLRGLKVPWGSLIHILYNYKCTLNVWNDKLFLKMKNCGVNATSLIFKSFHLELISNRTILITCKTMMTFWPEGENHSVLMWPHLASGLWILCDFFAVQGIWWVIN